MKRIPPVAASMSISACLTYLLFSWSEVQSLFPAPVVIMTRQFLVVVFCVGLWIAPKRLIDTAQVLAPKVMGVINALYTALFTKKKDDES